MYAQTHPRDAAHFPHLNFHEIDPGYSGRVYDLFDDSMHIGQVVATTSTKTLGNVPPSSLLWSALPIGANFTLMLSTSGAPMTGPAQPLYHAFGYKSVASVPVPASGGWKIVDGNAVVFAYFVESLLIFVQGGSTPHLIGGGATFTWDSGLQIPPAGTYQISVNLRLN
jgi:hypothetical protein